MNLHKGIAVQAFAFVLSAGSAYAQGSINEAQSRLWERVFRLSADLGAEYLSQYGALIRTKIILDECNLKNVSSLLPDAPKAADYFFEKYKGTDLSDDSRIAASAAMTSLLYGYQMGVASEFSNLEEQQKDMQCVIAGEAGAALLPMN